MRYFFLLAGISICFFACNIRKVLNPTAREKYERNFEGPDSLLVIWQESYEKALMQPSSVDLPFTITARSQDIANTAIGYQFVVNSGQELIVELDRQGNAAAYFIELIKGSYQSNSKSKLIEAMDASATLLRIPVEQTDTIRLLVQPSIYNQSLFRLRIYPQPAYLFPVAGKGNAAISSFWGAARDGGSRSHEGVDIIAPRGTPLVAVTDGRVTSTGERGLGGKQVWLRDAVFGHRIYYAHLDSIVAATGQQVQRGDTIGLVGNTGNAITTVPHLHFGVYTNDGPVDPLLFIRKTEIPSFSDTVLGKAAITRYNRNDVRTGPATRFPLIQALSKNDTVLILGKTRDWYHITWDSIQGFMPAAALRTIF